MRGRAAGDPLRYRRSRLEEDLGRVVEPRIWWVIVEPASAPRKVFFLASSMPSGSPRALPSLAVAQPDVARAVTDDHERGEGEPPTTLDHLRDPVDRDDSLFVLAFGHDDLSCAG